MHKLNVLILGSQSFISTLNELKAFLKFNPILSNTNKNFEAVLFDTEALVDKRQKEIIDKTDVIKIIAKKTEETLSEFDADLVLPTSLREINIIVESAAAKKKFNINSSIKIRDYFLNKNEKKLSKLKQFIILTEKEIQLLELLLTNKKPLSKDKILSLVWNYSSDADTHTVETHIYRLRKKILDKFMDEKFILNSKDGYYL